VDRDDFTVRKRGGVKTRRILRVLVKPEADRVFWLHMRVLVVLERDHTIFYFF